MIFRLTAGAAAALGIALAGSVFAAPAKKHPVKHVKPAGHLEMGTHQMPGTNAQFGEVYTAKEGESDPINFAITSAEYTIAPVWTSQGNDVVAKPDEKVVEVHYRIKNPGKTDFYCSGDFPVQIVDSSNQTISPIDSRGRELNGDGDFGASLKPGQGVDDLVDFFVISAKGPALKFIVNMQPVGTHDQVMRYPIGTGKNIIKPLEAPYADPADPTGATALQELNGEIGKEYISGEYSFHVDSFAYAPGPFGDHTPDDGTRFLVVSLTVTNIQPVKAFFYGTFVIQAKSADDSYANYFLIKSQSDDDFQNRDQDAGEKFPMRMLVQVPTNANVKSLTIRLQDGSRPVTYDLSNVK